MIVAQISVLSKTQLLLFKAKTLATYNSSRLTLLPKLPNSIDDKLLKDKSLYIQAICNNKIESIHLQSLQDGVIDKVCSS